MSSEKVATMPSASSVLAPPPPPPPPPSSGSNRQSPPTSTKKKAPSPSSSPASSASASPSVSPTSSSGSVPTKATSANAPLPPLVPVYTKPAILGLPPTAVLTKQEMDFRANLLNPNNDLFWTARGLIRPPVLADALAQGHAILKYEGHLTQKQGGRRLSAQYGRSGASGPTTAAAVGAGVGALPLGFGSAVVSPPGGVAAAVQGSWRSAGPVLAPNPAFVTKEDMDVRANQLNPNNDVFWSSRGLIRPSVLADALAQGHAILQHEGHLTQTQTHKSRGRLNSQPSLYATSDLGRPADTRRSVSGQGLPGSGIGSGAGRIGGGGRAEEQPMAMRRRASTTGSILNRPPPLDGSVTKDEVDLRANLMNPNNSVFWTSRGLTRPADLQEALAKGHAVLEAEGHVTHNTGGRSKSWNRRGSRTELHGPPTVSPLVAAAQRQWSTPFLAPNAGITAMPPTSLSARPGGLPGAAWVAGPVPSAAAPASSRHPDWQSNAQQRRRYSLPPPGFELFTPPSHFALFRPPIIAQQQPKQQLATPFVKEGAADSEWDKMDAEAISKPLPHSAAIPIIKPTAADIAAAKKSASESASSAWVKKAPSADSKKSTGVFLRDDKSIKEGDDKKKIEEESKAMKQEDKKKASSDSTKSDVEMKDANGVTPSAPTTPATSTTTTTTTNDKVGSLAWQLAQVKLRTRRPSEARESDISTKSATA